MKSSRWLVLLLFQFAALPAQAQLSVRLEVDRKWPEARVYYDAPVTVVLRNESDQAIRIWDLDTKRGQGQISFEFADPKTGKTASARWREINDDAYWKALSQNHRSRPAAIEIAARGETKYEIVLGNFAWGERAWTGLPSPNGKEPYQVTARFANADNSQPGIWTGSVKSAAVSAVFLAPLHSTPHDYLRSHFADKAIELMAADKKLIDARNKDGCQPLHEAARYGPPAAVAWLLEHGANVNAVAYNKFTPLHLADDPEIVRLILQRKPDLTRRDASDETPLQQAADRFVTARSASERERWGQIVKQLMDAMGGADLRSAIMLGDGEQVKATLTKSPKLADDFQDASPLRTAACYGQLEICRYLLDNFKVDVNDWERGVGYPIIKEALPHAKIVELLIDRGADLKKRISWQGGFTGRWLIGQGATLLHHAAADGTPETIKLLIDHGVEIDAIDHPLFSKEENQTALEIASLVHRTENARAIVSHPKFAQIEKVKKQAMLDKCLRRGSLGYDLRAELLEVLIEAGANVNTTSDEGITPLQSAARNIHPTNDEKNVEIKRAVALLRKHGAKLDLFSAVAIGDEAEVKKLLAADPKTINVRGPDGYPALHFAVGMDYRNIIVTLLQAGADVNIRNESKHTGNFGETALECADFWERDELIKVLEAAGGQRKK